MKIILDTPEQIAKWRAERKRYKLLLLNTLLLYIMVNDLPYWFRLPQSCVIHFIHNGSYHRKELVSRTSKHG